MSAPLRPLDDPPDHQQTLVCCPICHEVRSLYDCDVTGLTDEECDNATLVCLNCNRPVIMSEPHVIS
jgi:hypothetical protein